eukprot:5612129-Pyramimonas_sp.AAC.1
MWSCAASDDYVRGVGCVLAIVRTGTVRIETEALRSRGSPGTPAAHRGDTDHRCRTRDPGTFLRKRRDVARAGVLHKAVGGGDVHRHYPAVRAVDEVRRRVGAARAGQALPGAGGQGAPSDPGARGDHARPAGAEAAEEKKLAKLLETKTPPPPHPAHAKGSGDGDGDGEGEGEGEE